MRYTFVCWLERPHVYAVAVLYSVAWVTEDTDCRMNTRVWISFLKEGLASSQSGMFLHSYRCANLSGHFSCAQSTGRV